MKPLLKIRKKNEVYVTVDCDDVGIHHELKDFFKFKVPGYKFMPAYRNKLWSGDIYLYDTRTRQIYGGLIEYLQEFAETRGAEIEYVDDDYYGRADTQAYLDLDAVTAFTESLQLYAHGKAIQPRDYQLEAIHHALVHYRSLLLSPTASGKSLIIYVLIRYFLEENTDKKVLLIVPTTSLCRQMESDFAEYSTLDESWSAKDDIGVIMGGLDKDPKIEKLEITLEDGTVQYYHLDDVVETQRGKVLAAELRSNDLVV